MPLIQFQEVILSTECQFRRWHHPGRLDLSGLKNGSLHAHSAGWTWMQRELIPHPSPPSTSVCISPSVTILSPSPGSHLPQGGTHAMSPTTDEGRQSHVGRESTHWVTPKGGTRRACSPRPEPVPGPRLSSAADEYPDGWIDGTEAT